MVVLTTRGLDPDADRRLVEAHRAGDPDAFGRIVRDHYAALLSQARHRLGNIADAEDAVQDTLLRAYRSLDRFGETGDYRLGAWLARILTNVCTDVATRRHSSRALTERLASGAGPREPDVADGSTYDPVALAAVSAAMATLPSNQRRAFMLRVVDDLPYREVAEQLGITEDNARARVQRARTTLRSVLSGAGMLAAAPLMAVTSLRNGLRRVFSHVGDRGGYQLGQGATTSASYLPAGPTASAAANTAATTLNSVSSAAAPVASSTMAVASPAAASSVVAAVPASVAGPISSGVQAVSQLAAAPLTQAAVVVSSVGGAKGSVVLGLVASLVTAGSLSAPAVSALSSSAPAAAAPATAQLLSTAGAATATTRTSGTTTTTATTATTTGATSQATGDQSTSTTGSQGGSSTTFTQTVLPAPASQSQILQILSSAPGVTTTAPQPAGGTAGGGVTGATGAGTQGATATTTSTAGAGPGPADDCASATASAVDAASSAATSSTSLLAMLSTGSVSATVSPSAVSFAAPASVLATSSSPRSSANVVVGSCLAAGHSFFTADVKGANGGEVQLVGAPLAGSTTGSTAATTTSDANGDQLATYLFSGTVTPLSTAATGTHHTGITEVHAFVAELQVAQQGAAASLTVAFVQATGGSSSPPAPSSPSSASSVSQSPSTPPATPSASPTSDTTKTTAVGATAG